MRWGLAGYGDLAGRRLIDAFRQTDQELITVWGRNVERARAFASQHRIPRVAPTLPALCVEVDAIYVAMPVSAHVPIAEAAVRAGRHVLIEKPANVGIHRVDPLLDASAARGRTLGVAYYRRLAPALRSLRAVIASGELGQIHRADVFLRTQFEPSPDDPKHWRTDPAIAGAGILADVGCHRLDLLCWLFGPPERVEGCTGDRFPRGAERWADVTLAWATGTEATCHFEWQDGPARDRFAIIAERGELVLDPLDGGELHVNGCGVASRVQHHEACTNPHAALIEDFARAVAGGMAPACSLEQALVVDTIIHGISTHSHLQPLARSGHDTGALF
jgi:predicted dehydrogenase